MARFTSRFRGDQSGATAIEYALIAALVFLAVIGAVTIFAGQTTDLMAQVSAAVTSVIADG